MIGIWNSPARRQGHGSHPKARLSPSPVKPSPDSVESENRFDSVDTEESPCVAEAESTSGVPDSPAPPRCANKGRRVSWPAEVVTACHIFEKPMSDLEKLRLSMLAGGAVPAAPVVGPLDWREINSRDSRRRPELPRPTYASETDEKDHDNCSLVLGITAIAEPHSPQLHQQVGNLDHSSM